MRWLRRVSVMAGSLVLAVSLVQGSSALAATSPQSSAAGSAHSVPGAAESASKSGTAATAGPVRLADPAKVLPSGWQRSSDEAVTVSGDATGLHVLAASEASGYAWRTVATLGDPGVETDLWVGQACVTAGGRYAVVVYAPEQATNMAQAQGVLGRAAIVDLRTGAVKDLGGGFSIAYFDPGCGTGNDAVLTEGGWANDDSDGPMSTSLVVADTLTGKVSAPVKVAGQITSAVPFDGQIAAAGGRGVEQVSMSGRTRLLAGAGAVPFRLTPAADGSLGYQVMAGKSVDLWQLAGGRARRVASAAAGSVELRQIGGRTWLVGPEASRVAGLPHSWQPVDVPAISQPSTTGTLAVIDAATATPAKGQHYDPAAAQPVTINAQLLTGNRGAESFKVATQSAPAPAAAPATAVATAKVSETGSRGVEMAAAVAGSPSTPVSADRTCAIALDDPTIQAYQPTFQQVEWAADQAVQGTLTDTRPAGLYGSSLPSYTPQGLGGLFPLPTVDGGGQLPAQVLLGVLTQESNLQQASTHVIQGQTANPLSSFNWYGNWIDNETVDTGLINWSASDCGYGIGQITSGMCMAGNPNKNNECAGQSSTTLTSTQQLAVAVDYQANIAAAAQLLINEWNTLYSLGITPTDSPPTKEETVAPDQSDYIGDWYMAIWAYNSGLEPGSPDLGNTTGCSPSSSCTDGDGNWGLGYADNPINPAYPPDRPIFPGASAEPAPGGTGIPYSVSWDMSNPQYWPYQEKVNGWAFDSITLWDYSRGADVQAFAYGPGSPEVASFGAFCVPGAGTATTAGDNCDDSGVNTTSATDSDSCQLTGSTYGDHCWWHWPASVNPTTIDNGDSSSCVKANDCGLGVITYPAGAAEPAAEPIAAQFAQTCVSDLSDTAVIVGDGGQAALGCPDQNWTSQGSFTWNFAADENGNYSSKIYFDQIGAGFGGHFWFGYSQPAATPTSTVITGTWNPPTSVSGWTDIKVAIPSYGANADDAVYTVDPGGGASGKSVQIDQGDTSGTNAWVDLGDFDLTSGASVSLSNVTPDYSGSSVTSQDLAWSAAAFIPTSGPSWDYTAMGDSYSTGQGNLPYDPNNDNCNRSNAAFPRQFAADTPSIGSSEIQHIACSGAEIENLTTTGQNGELPQIAQMSSSAKLVTVTIGGNDIDFSSVLTNCLLNPLTTCESAYNSANSSNLYTTIDDLKPELVSAYQDIKAAAPDADIVAVTYPLLFTPGTPCVGLSVPDVTFLNNVGEYLDNAIISSAQQAGIDVLDERYAFLGHQLCSSDPWVFSPTDTTVTDTSSAFHPTAAGLSQMAGDLGAYWSALQAGSAPTIWPQSVTAPVNGWLPLNLPYGIPTTAQAEAMLASLSNISAYAGDYNASASYWNFTTRNGCTTRDRVLQDEALTTTQWSAAQPLTPPDGGCPVQYGSWETPYDVDATSPTTPQRVTYNASNNNLSTGLQIDHIVPKSNAWETGAADWEEDYGDAQGGQMLTDFTNDRGGPELLAVSAASNGSKGNSPPEIWMPANPGMTCAYAKMWIAVKWEWNLEVGTIADGINGNEPTERIFLQDTLNGC